MTSLSELSYFPSPGSLITINSSPSIIHLESQLLTPDLMTPPQRTLDGVHLEQFLGQDNLELETSTSQQSIPISPSCLDARIGGSTTSLRSDLSPLLTPTLYGNVKQISPSPPSMFRILRPQTLFLKSITTNSPSKSTQEEEEIIQCGEESPSSYGPPLVTQTPQKS